MAVPQPVYALPGIPSTPPALLQASTWQAFTSGVDTLVGQPLPGANVFLAGTSNNGAISTVTGFGAMWRQVGIASILSGAFSVAELWMTVAPSRFLVPTVHVVESTPNVQSLMVAQFKAGRQLQPLANVAGTHSGSGSLVIGSVSAAGSKLAIVVAGNRGGTLVTPAGWTEIANVSNGPGQNVMAYQLISSGQSVSATFTGPTNNSAGVIVVLG